MNAPAIHLLVDGTTQMSFTAEYLRRFLTDLVHEVGMTVVLGPGVVRTKHTWDAWVVLAESHALLHARCDVVHVDLFSCKGYDTTQLLELITARLKLVDVGWRVIERPIH